MTKSKFRIGDVVKLVKLEPEDWPCKLRVNDLLVIKSLALERRDLGDVFVRGLISNLEWIYFDHQLELIPEMSQSIPNILDI